MHRICRTKAFVSAPFGKRVDCIGRGATPGVVVAATLFISQLSVRSDGVHLRKARLVVSFFLLPFSFFFSFSLFIACSGRNPLSAKCPADSPRR